VNKLKYMIGKLFKATFQIAVELPIAVVKDVFTLGGSITDESKPYTNQKVEEIAEDLDKTE